jgi:hypothetical protein
MAEVVDRMLEGENKDGNTHVPLVSLPDRLTSIHLGHQAQGTFIDPFHAVSPFLRHVSLGLWRDYRGVVDPQVQSESALSASLNERLSPSVVATFEY